MSVVALEVAPSETTNGLKNPERLKIFDKNNSSTASNLEISWMYVGTLEVVPLEQQVIKKP